MSSSDAPIRRSSSPPNPIAQLNLWSCDQMRSLNPTSTSSPPTVVGKGNRCHWLGMNSVMTRWIDWLTGWLMDGFSPPWRVIQNGICPQWYLPTSCFCEGRENSGTVVFAKISRNPFAGSMSSEFNRAKSEQNRKTPNGT